MSGPQYVVTGAYITNVPSSSVNFAGQLEARSYSRGEFLAADVPADRIRHLLSVGLIAGV
ncbi:hypothetical protein ACFV1N_05855 [Streptosporangium canum]|uniref:hypothetical protein n=1 Tax=Streptosporangium canum TaxID=324952 RepID=UPI00367D93A3